MAVESGDSGMVTAVVAAIAALVSSVVTHVLGRPKQRADAHAAIAEGASTAVDAITDVLLQVKVELEEARIEIGKLRDENKALRQSVARLNIQITELQRLADSQKHPSI